MSKDSKDRLEVGAFSGTDLDPTWVGSINGRMVFQTLGGDDEANAKELDRRWNAFGEDGIATALLKALQKAQDVIEMQFTSMKKAGCAGILDQDTLNCIASNMEMIIDTIAKTKE